MVAQGRELNVARQQNLKRVLRLLINEAPISRAEIARQTGMSRSTVSSVFSALDRQGYVAHLGPGESTEAGGRRPDLYAFNGRYGYIASFNLTSAHLYMMLAYANGEKIVYDRLTLENRNVLSIMSSMENFLRQSKEFDDTKHGLLGIGISIHAIVDQNQVVDSPFIAMNGINLQEYFCAQYQVPVIVQNEANLSAVFERDYDTDEQEVANLAVMSIHRGLGVGIIANHQLVTGFKGRAGETGRLKFRNENGDWAQISDFCAEDYLVKAVADAIGLPGQQIDYEEIARLFERKDPRVMPLIPFFASMVGTVVYNVLMAYGPEIIYLNSNLLELLPAMTDAIAVEAKKLGVDVPLKVMRHSSYVPMYGATSLVIRQALDLKTGELAFQWQTNL